MTVAPVERRSDAPGDGAREHAGRVVHGVYRLVKGRLLHDDANQAITQLVDALVQAVADHCAATRSSSVSILFAANNVFVDRQMLRASRETYQLALELGQMLEPFGVTELSLSHPLDRGEAHELGSAIALAQRDRSLARKERLAGWTSIRARRVVAFNGGPRLTPAQSAARTYAASVLIVQSFYRQLKEGATDLPHAVKRVAQRLVTAAEEDSRLLLVIAASPTSGADRAAGAVSAAIIALAMARQLVSDRSALLALASAAILYDAGRPRLARSAMSGIERNLSEAELEKLPASTVASLTALGKLHPGSIARSVVAYEALALRLGAAKVYGGRRPPSVLARVLHAARTFVEARASQGPVDRAGSSMDDAVQALFGQARDATERTYAKLLLGALGLFPAGTLVELTTGELAVVTATPRLPIDFARPPVRILYDRDANLLEEPIDVDLAAPTAGEPPRLIQRAVDADDQQMRRMRAYVAGLSTAASRAPRKEAPPSAAPAPRPRTGAAPAAATVPPRRPSTANRAAVTDRPRADRRADEAVPSEVAGGLAAAPMADPTPAASAPPPAPERVAPTAPPATARAASTPPPADAAPQRSTRPPAVEVARAHPTATAASTRAMSWDQYGQLVDETQPAPRRRTSPSAPAEVTDALLAAYLDEQPSRGSSSHGLRGWGNEPPSSRDSSRAEPASSGGARSSSRAGWAAVPSSRRSEWGGSPSSRRPAPTSSSPPSREAAGSGSDPPPRSRSISGRSRTSTVDWTAGPRSPASMRGGPAPRHPSSRPPVASRPPDEPPSTGRKPKSGSAGWGADKK